ncbi:MAG TPA: hypothetical protein VL624_15085 [Caldimonas sp.]|jgi:hypothetical protein|nr:hypothetical protein [Caldimonas sp.]
MKEYVLDEPASPAAPAAEGLPHVPATLPPQPWPWRTLLVLAVVEPLALGALYLGLNADPHPRARAEPSAGPATIAAFAFPSVPGQAAAAPIAAGAAEESRIAFERGKYVIDLRSTDIGPALAMLAEATKATVHGADALAREPTQLSRSAVVATPAEAWQAVLGDVASFAISCSQKACAVFVTAAAKGDRAATLALAAPSFAPANVVGSSEMPAVDPIAAAAAIAAAKSANGALPPGAVQTPENGESDN